MIVFEELGRGGCRWPIADCGPAEAGRGAFLFCGEAAADKVAPYCAGHMAAAYKRPRVRAAIVVKTREAGRRKLIELAASHCAQALAAI